MSTPNPNQRPEQERMPVRTPGLADALRRLAEAPQPTYMPRRSNLRSIDRFEAQLREIYALIQRQFRLFAAVFAGTAVVLGLMVVLQTPQFESTALLLVKFGRELIYTPQVGDQRAVTSRDKQTVINSELAIMRSEPVIEGAVAAVGLPNLYPDLAEQLTESAEEPEAEQVASSVHAMSVARLREGLVVLALPEADVLQVSFRHPDAAIAKSTVTSLIEKFTEAHLGAFGDPEVASFLEDRVADYRQTLDKAEAELREFEIAHPVFAEESPQAALTQHLGEIRQQIDAIDSQITQVRMSAVNENSALAQAQRDRLALELEASKVKGHLRENTNRRLAVVKQFIGARKGEVDSQIGLLQQRRAELVADLAKSEAERDQMPALSSAHRQLRRDRDAGEAQYATYEKRLQEARLSHEMDNEKLASISVIQKASVTPEAIWPLPPVPGIAVVLVLAFAIAVLSATLADHYGWTWPSHWDAEHLREGYLVPAERARRVFKEEYDRIVEQARRR